MRSHIVFIILGVLIILEFRILRRSSTFQKLDCLLTDSQEAVNNTKPYLSCQTSGAWFIWNLKIVWKGCGNDLHLRGSSMAKV